MGLFDRLRAKQQQSKPASEIGLDDYLRLQYGGSVANSTPAISTASPLREVSGIARNFTPAPGQSVGNFLNETRKAISPSIGRVGAAIQRNVLIPTGQATTRAGATLASRLLGQTITPKTQFEKDIFGTDKPLTFNRLGREFNPLVNPDAPSGAVGRVTYPVIGFAGGLSEFLGGGSANKAAKVVFDFMDVSKKLRNIHTVETAIPVLRRIGFPEEIALELAPEVAKSKSVKGINETLSNAATRLAQSGQSLSETGRIGTRPTGLLTRLISNSAGAARISNSLDETVPEASNAVKKIVSILSDAKPLIRGQEAAYSAERSKRVARLVAVSDKVKGEQGFRAALGQLKGALPRPDFQSIRSGIEQTDIDSLFRVVQDSRIFTPFEKVTAQAGLAKLLGAEGLKLPTRGELKLLSEVFPEEFTNAILAKRTAWDKLKTTAGDVLNLPRAVMATFDLSAPLRQGVFLIGRPKQFLPAFASMFKYAFSPKAYEGLVETIQRMPDYPLMREYGLAITNTGKFASQREELFMSNLAERIPGFGRLVKGSERAYVGFLNKLRADTFADLAKNARQLGIDKERPEVYASIAKFVNSATGRGDLGSLERAAVVLNGLFFSPRLMASRFNLLNPHYYMSLDPFVRKEALKSAATFAATALTTLTLAKLGGASVEIDPRSSDFGKIKIGDTRYDILGGFQQYIRIASQLITGKIISSTTGKEITLGEGYKPLTRKDILLRFFESKSSPVASFVIGMLQGTNSLGEKFDVPKELISRFVPLVSQDLFDLNKEWGPKGLLMGVPAVFGVGTQTYGKQELVRGRDALNQETTEINPVKDLSQTVREAIFGKEALPASKTFNVQAFHEQMKKLPKEQAAAIFEQIAQENPDLADKLAQIAKDDSLGITVEEQSLKDKGVVSGDRAFAIAEKFASLDSKEEKAKLWNDYIEKGIITDDVNTQLLRVLSETDGKATERGFVDVLFLYAKAIGTDPADAFQLILHNNRIRKIENGTLIIERNTGTFGGDTEFSSKVRKERGATDDSMILDHTIPVELGGLDERSNVVLIPREQWASNSPVENFLGRLLRADKIEKKQAQSLILDYKEGRKTFEQIQQELGEKVSKADTGEESPSQDLAVNRPQRNKNPLNIKVSPTTIAYDGVSGVDRSAATDGGEFLQFDSMEDGWRAAERLITSDNYQRLSVNDALRRWSNKGYGGEIVPELLNRKMSSLTEDELREVVVAMAEREGAFDGLREQLVASNAGRVA